MDGRRDGMIWTLLAAGSVLAALLLVAHRPPGFRTSTPGAPSRDRAETRGGALFTLSPELPAPAEPPPDAIFAAERGAREADAPGADTLLASVADPDVRSAVCRALRPGAVDSRVIARLSTETDPAVIPAAVSLLARTSEPEARDVLLRLAFRAGTAGYHDLVEEVFARDDRADAGSLALLAGAGLAPALAADRGRILERLEDAGTPTTALRDWASREPDPDLRERLQALLHR